MSSSAALRAVSIAPALLALALTGGCASEPIALRTRPLDLPSVSRIQAPVAYSHAPSFREHVDVIEPYGNRYYATLKTGEAADRIFRAAYESRFAQLRELRSGGDAAPDAVVLTVEPARLDFLNASGRFGGPYYARVHYRFKLQQPDGVSVAAWTVRGFGAFDPDEERKKARTAADPGPRGEHELYSEAPLRAIADAAVQFVKSFDRVPELIAWRGGHAPALRNARELQQTRVLKESAAIEGVFPGALRLELSRAALPELPVMKEDSAEPQSKPLPLTVVRLRLHNPSGHRLAFDPEAVEWIQSDGVRVEPLPAPMTAALITGRPFGLAIAVFGPGVAALPAALAALASAASQAEKQKELARWKESLRAALLADSVLAPGESREGLIVLPSAPGSGEALVPLIDLDDAIRYTVRLPLDGH